MRRIVLSSAAALAAVAPTAAVAVDGPAFCAGAGAGPVDKGLIADALLDSAGVTRGFQRRVDALGSNALGGLSSAEAIVTLNLAICSKLKCSDDEKEQVTKAGFGFASLLRDARHVAVTGDADPRRFFGDAGSSLRCVRTEVADIAASPAGDKGDRPPDALFDPKRIRIRGEGADLVYERGKVGFDDASKAKLSFSDDREAKKTATTLVGAIGYAFTSSGQVNKAKTARLFYGAIPYIAANVDTSRTEGKSRDVKSNQLEVGADLFLNADLLSTSFAGYATHTFALTPRYLVNYEDDSAFVGANFVYRPTILFSPSFGLNRIVDIPGTKLRWTLVLDGRIAYGHFVRVGSRTGFDAQDFLRAGPRFGFTVTNATKTVPIELTVTDTWLGAISGGRSNLNLFKGDLAVYFNKEKYFGVDVGYAKGRDDDFGEVEDSWTIGFVVRY